MWTTLSNILFEDWIMLFNECDWGDKLILFESIHIIYCEHWYVCIGAYTSYTENYLKGEREIE